MTVSALTLALTTIGLAGSVNFSAAAESVVRTVTNGSASPTATTSAEPITSGVTASDGTTTGSGRTTESGLSESAEAVAAAKATAAKEAADKAAAVKAAAAKVAAAKASAAAQAVVTKALAYAQARGEQAAIAVYDRTTGRSFTAGDVNAQFQSASVVKDFIVAQLFWSGQMSDAAIAAQAYRMIVESNDDDANYLYGLVGSDELSSIVAKKLGLTGLAPPPVSGSWGSTYITAAAMVTFYKKVLADPAIGPWLTNAMAHTEQTAADGTDQWFGIPSAASSWAVKQGWVCCEEDVAGINSTGLVDNDRYIVVILTQGSPSQYLDYMTGTITTMAQVLFPKGRFPA